MTYVLALGTAVDVLLLGLGASPNSKGGFDVTVYETRMNVPTRGLDVTIIEGSKSSGRVFFAGKGDNDVYEITYQVSSQGLVLASLIKVGGGDVVPWPVCEGLPHQ